MSELNCEQLPGRLRHICQGYDDHGNPVLTPEKVERYRQFFLDGQFGSDHSKAASAINEMIATAPAVELANQRRARVVSWLKFLRAPTDKGLGDTVERILAKAGGRKIKQLIASLGGSCGCTNRQQWLNRRFPY